MKQKPPIWSGYFDSLEAFSLIYLIAKLFLGFLLGEFQSNH